jgi:glycosyltransferase involved in cell wall biosynthesis
VGAAAAFDRLPPEGGTGLPRIAIVGPMIGRNAGFVTTQGEFLTDVLRSEGHWVVSASSARTPAMRLISIPTAVLRHRGHVDILIVQTYGGRSFLIEDLASLLGRRSGHRVVFHLHGGDLPRFMERHSAWVRRVLARADALVAPSPFIARAVAPYAGPCRVIPNILDLTRYPFRPRTPARGRLLWMRSFHRLYNPLMAIEVLADVRQRVATATLVMAGQDKGEERRVRQEVERRGLTSAVSFPGFLNEAAKQREFGQADIFINTNHVDNAPVAVLEAAAVGIPVITTDVGGLRDLLREGDSGLLVPDGDAGAMANAVVRVIEDAQLAQRLAYNGRRLAEGSSWEAVRPQWQALFAELTGPGPAGGCR